MRPDIIGPGDARLRFSNAFGTRPVTLDAVSVGVQLERCGRGAADVLAPVTFAGVRRVTIAPGAVGLERPDAAALRPAAGLFWRAASSP